MNTLFFIVCFYLFFFFITYSLWLYEFIFEEGSVPRDMWRKEGLVSFAAMSCLFLLISGLLFPLVISKLFGKISDIFRK